MKKITQETIREIKRKFKTEKGYFLSKERQIYCPQVNGLTNICLSKLGFLKESKTRSLQFLKGRSFNAKTKLFHREVDSEGKIIISEFNSGKNAIFALSLLEFKFVKDAKEIMNALIKSPLYMKKTGLFFREYNSVTKKINPLIITQTNLWIALVYAKLKMKKAAKKIISSLEKMRKNYNNGLFISQDCRNIHSENRFFLDDQAIAVLVYVRLNEKLKAKNLIKATLKSPLYDIKSGLFNSSFSNSNTDKTKSTYKNSLMAFALGRLEYTKQLRQVQEGLVRELYDSKDNLFYQSTKDKTKVPDNSALALVALKYNWIKQRGFL